MTGVRILVLGAGAIGGFYGARLIESGARVDFLVREARAALLTEHGLRLHSESGSFDASVSTLTQLLPDARYDLIILSCKATDLDSAIAAITPAVGENTRVLPLLNGLRHMDALDAAFGGHRVLGGLAHISVTLGDDGAITQFGQLDRLTYGGRDGDSVPPEIAAALDRASFKAVNSDDIIAAMWSKFVFIAALAGLTALLRGSVGEITATPDGTRLAQRLFLECAQIAAQSGYPPDARARSEAEQLLGTPGLPLKASLLRDIERDAPTEGEHILGDMLARARRLEMEVPLLAAATTHVRVYEGQRQARTDAVS